jgi:UDP-N-acetylmuramate--alanine ligase
VKAVVGGITVIDDYGHHPAEIRATLEAARGYKRLLVLFQPHRYTRTKYLWDEFCNAFNRADLLILADIYAASETPISGVTSEALAAAICAAGHTQVLYRSTLQEGIDALLAAARPGDAILTIGAGNIGRAADELAQLIGAPDAARHAKVVNHADH